MKISVITGIYNPPEILFRKFLDSCIKTTCTDVEFILILDDPNDYLSRQILNEYKQSIDNNHNQFKIIENKENTGVNQTHYDGLLKASGDYIVFFDNDDFFDEDYLEIAYKYIIEYNYPNILKGCAITHYLGKIDYLFEYMIGSDKTSNDDDWLLFIRRDISIKYLSNYDFVVEESDDRRRNIKNEMKMAKKIPLYEASFYHYIRHENNTSKTSININYNLNKDNVNCQEVTKRHLINRLSKDKININDNIENTIKEYTILDKTPNNDFNYERIKNI